MGDDRQELSMSSHSPLPGPRFTLYEEGKWELLATPEDFYDYIILHKCQVSTSVRQVDVHRKCGNCGARPPERIRLLYTLAHEEPNKLVFSEDWYCGGLGSGAPITTI